MSVSTLRRDSQRLADAPLPIRGIPSLFSKEAEVNMASTVVAMQFLKARVTRHDVMAMTNYIQKGTPTAKIFNNKSVNVGWYQAWLSQLTAKGIL